MNARTRQRGSVMIEFPMVIGLVLIPFGMLAISASTWVERQTAARDAAGESARALVISTGETSVSPAQIVQQIESGYGLAPGTLRAEVPEGAIVPGESVTVNVTVEIPALVVPILGNIGSVDWTAEHTERIPDYGADR